jgi:sugar/nucleoside kinase (ribokinase family)
MVRERQESGASAQREAAEALPETQEWRPVPRPRAASQCSVDVLGLGQNSVDHILRVHRCPSPGGKTDAIGYQLLPGGQVATAILTAHRLGQRACYLGAVGDDPLGEHALSVLRGDGVQVEIEEVRGGTTQFAMIVVDDRGERTIVEHYDRRVVVSEEALARRQALCEDARILHLDVTEGPSALIAARWARAAGTIVSLDIDRILPGTLELLPLVDLLVASEDLPRELGCEEGASSEEALRTLRRHCPGLVCITLGDRGCAALDRDHLIEVPAFSVPVLDTTGCGDVFRGALIHGVLREWPWPWALRFASAAGALQAGAIGAQSGVPRLAEVERFLESGPRERPRAGG